MTQSIKDETQLCRRCGRKLRSEKAKQLGMGEVCYAKTIQETSRKKLISLQKKSDTI